MAEPNKGDDFAVGLVPADAFKAAMEDRDRLFDIIDRAAGALGAIEAGAIEEAIGLLRDAPPGRALPVSLALRRCFGEIFAIRDILAEAEPEDLEGGGGEHG
jgi:hypothetical protein